MNPHFERGRILYQHRRYDLAAQEFRRAIAVDPVHGKSMGMLALCQVELKQRRQALETARQAIASDTEEAFCHYAYAYVLFRTKRLKEASGVIREAIRLNPDNAGFYGIAGLIEFNANHWQKALEFAEQGLRINPEEINASIARIRALDRLGRKAESQQASAELLRIGPDDQFVHSNIGWSFLEQSDHQRALEHFREALRINPDLEPARKGLVEALKCRFLGYRVFRWCMVWFQSHSQRLTLLSTVFWVVFLMPIGGLLLLGLYLRPLLAATVRFDRYGRQVLSRDQIWESNLTCGATLLSIACFVATFFTKDWQWIPVGILLFCISILTNVAFRSHRGWPRWLSLSLVALFLFGMIALRYGLAAVYRADHELSTTSVEGEAIGVSFSIGYFAFLALAVILTRLAKIVPKD
ncbi:MAG TPA: tetratricopeptide repeat protein [Pirellulales bacterium]|jgi:tetratricopeptide (TPR) repeat protein